MTRLRYLLRLLLIVLMVAALAPLSRADEPVELHVFWSLRCPHCLQALPQLRALAADTPWLRLSEHEISQSAANLEQFQAMAAALGETAQAVPTLFYCGHMEVGWDDSPSHRQQLLDRLTACRSGQQFSANPPPAKESVPNL